MLTSVWLPNTNVYAVKVARGRVGRLIDPSKNYRKQASTKTKFSLNFFSLQYKTERDGVVETRVEQKITIQSDGDPIDHDKALAEAIQVRFRLPGARSLKVTTDTVVCGCYLDRNGYKPSILALKVVWLGHSTVTTWLQLSRAIFLGGCHLLALTHAFCSPF